MPRVAQPIFRRGLTYVAVRPIRMTRGTTVEPGTVIDLPNYRLRSLHLRRKIGPKGHPWTEYAIKAAKASAKTVKPTVSAEAAAAVTEAVEKDPRPFVIVDTDLRFATKKEAQAAAQEGQTVTKDGLIWVKGGERFKTKKAAEAA